MNNLSSRQNRAGSLLRILGEHLPPEVYKHLGPEETGKLLETFHKPENQIRKKRERFSLLF